MMLYLHPPAVLHPAVYNLLITVLVSFLSLLSLKYRPNLACARRVNITVTNFDAPFVYYAL
jgi:hypothetical protein